MPTDQPDPAGLLRERLQQQLAGQPDAGASICGHRGRTMPRPTGRPRGRPRKAVKAPRHQIGYPLAGMTIEQERRYAETLAARYHDLGMTQLVLPALAELGR